MDDEELLFKQVKLTTAATPGTTVWIYRNTVYAYPWYTSVRKTLEDPAYAPWFVHVFVTYIFVVKNVITETQVHEVCGEWAVVFQKM